MRSVQTWLVLIVAVALAGGMFAFLMSTPSGGQRIARSELGFRSLGRDRVEAVTGTAAVHYQARALRDELEASATAAGRGWLAALPASRGRKVTPVKARAVVVPGAAGATAVKAADLRGVKRATAFVRWADDLPAAVWRAQLSSATATDELAKTDEIPTGPVRYEASGTVTVTVAQASSRTRAQKVPVTITLEGRPVDGAVPKRWTLVDVDAGGRREFTRAYLDPTVVVGTTVDVVAPASAAADARSIASEVERRVAAVRGAEPRIEGAAGGTVWLLAAPADAKATLGALGPGGAYVGDPHAVAWTDSRGELAVDLAARAAATVPARVAAIRHAAAHLALRNLDTYAPAILVEGVAARATADVDGVADDDPTRTRITADERRAFSTGSSGIARLLAAPPGDPLGGSSPAAARMRAGMARLTVDWVVEVKGQRSLERLLAALDRGDQPAGAVERVLELEPRQVERAIARWARARDVAAAKRATRSSELEAG